MSETAQQGLRDTQAGKRIGLAPQTLRNLRCQGKGPAYVKIGRAVRYFEEDLVAYLEKRRIDPEK